MNDSDPVTRNAKSGRVQGVKPGGSRLFRLSRLLLALMFAGATLLYNVYWVIANQPAAAEAAEPGFDANYLPEEHALLVTGVRSNSPADNAGLRAGDRITEIYGTRIKDQDFQPNEWKKHKPGEIVHLTILRPGQGKPLPLTGRFRQVQPPGGYLQSFSAVLASVQRFSAGIQSDDLTLLIGRCITRIT